MVAKRKTVARKRRGKKPVKRATVAPARDPLAAGSGLAPGMQAVNSYLAVANVAATMEFLERAFGFVRGVVLPAAGGGLRYAEMRHGDSVVMLIPKGEATSASGGAAALYTYVHDVDRAVTQARAAGANVGVAEDKPWGDRVATVTDPDGYRWVLATFKKLAPFT
jgi:PhnB protein